MKFITAALQKAAIWSTYKRMASWNGAMKRTQWIRLAAYTKAALAEQVFFFLKKAYDQKYLTSKFSSIPQ